ncbi:MAG: ThuA domain-containing protein [Planctomycetaceae bacterium]
MIVFFHRWLSLCLPVLLVVSALHADDVQKPLKVLVVTGGCCHDYPFQAEAMQKAAKERGVSVQWTIVNEGGTGTDAQIDLYKDPDWATGYDVVVHNECFAKTTDEDYIRSITKSHHEGTNAVVIHCAMHTYRDAKIDDWRQMLGVTSRRHDHKSNYQVKNAKPDHPVMKDFPKEWTTPNDELYIIEKVWPDTEVLATSVSEKTGDLHPVIWTHQYGKARVFGTTYGHANETFEDKVFLDVLINGIQWAAGR